MEQTVSSNFSQTSQPDKTKPIRQVSAFVVAGLILLGIGGVTGWQIGQGNVSSIKEELSRSQESQISSCVSKLQSECKEQISYKKYIIDPNSNWPGLITGSSLNFQMGGKITKIESGRVKNLSRTTYTLSSLSNPLITVPVYVPDEADYVKVFEGINMDSPQNLKQSSLKKLQVGDTVYIEASTPSLDNPKALVESIVTNNLDLKGELFFKFIK